jgi:hypothetical protein
MGKKKKKIEQIENIDMYKEFYFFEINRKHELNNAINIPVLILTLIFSINFYLLNQKFTNDIICIGKCLTIITILSVCYSTYFLISSFSNFAKNHHYMELTNMKEILSYEEENKNNSLIFQQYMKEEFSKCAAHNFLINTKRTEDLANSKKGIFISLITTFIFSIIYLVSIL